MAKQAAKPKKQRKPRFYSGNAPSEALGWQILESNDNWALYFNFNDPETTYISFKLCAKGKAATKANYWFSAFKDSLMIGRTRDLGLLMANRPELYDWSIKTAKAKMATFERKLVVIK